MYRRSKSLFSIVLTTYVFPKRSSGYSVSSAFLLVGDETAYTHRATSSSVTPATRRASNCVTADTSRGYVVWDVKPCQVGAVSSGGAVEYLYRCTAGAGGIELATVRKTRLLLQPPSRHAGTRTYIGRGVDGTSMTNRHAVTDSARPVATTTRGGTKTPGGTDL